MKTRSPFYEGDRSSSSAEHKMTAESPYRVGQSQFVQLECQQRHGGVFCGEGKDVRYEGDEEKISDRLCVLPAMADWFCVLYAFSNWVHDL